MADTNRAQVGLVAELTYGVTPASPAFQLMRITSGSAAPRLNTIRTREIRADRQVTAEMSSTKDASGDIAGEVSFGAFDLLFEAAFMNTWVSHQNNFVTAATATSLTLSTASGALYPKGAVIYASGFASSLLNGVMFPLAAAGTGSALAITGGAIETPAAGAGVRIVGFQCASGDCVASTAGGNKLTITSASGAWDTLGLAIGDWVLVGGAAVVNQYTTPGCNGECRISAISATVLSFDRVPAGWGADVGAAKLIRVAIGDRLTNASTIKSFTQKREFQDIAGFEYTKGMGVSRGVWGGQTGGLFEATFSMEGAVGVVQGTALSGETNLAAPAWQPMNMNANVGRIGMNGVEGIAGPNYATRMEFSANNNIRKRIPIGYDTTQSLGLGTFDATITLETYFGDLTLYQAVLSGAETSFDCAMRSDAGGCYIFDAPRVMAKSGTPTLAGADQDSMLPITYQCLRHASLGYTLLANRFIGAL